MCLLSPMPSDYCHGSSRHLGLDSPQARLLDWRCLNKISKEKKVDRTALSTVLINLGVLVPDSGIAMIFNLFGADKGNSVLNSENFIAAIENETTMYGDESDFSLSALRRRGAGKDGTGHDAPSIKSFLSRDGGVSKCEIATKILSDYDENVNKMAQLAFDMFDFDNSNTIKEFELERVMCSLGFDLSYQELDDLLDQIDKKNTGELEFQPFMAGVVGFIRNQYKNVVETTKAKMRDFFVHLDADRSGCLDHGEFAHVAQEMNAELSEDELNSLIEYLDRDQSNEITWTEFENLCVLFSDDRTVNGLHKTLRSAIRKMQFSSLPNPKTFIAMFAGLPVNYRKSVLGKVAKNGEHCY